MAAVGKDIRPEYRETARGAWFTTPTGKAVAQCVRRMRQGTDANINSRGTNMGVGGKIGGGVRSFLTEEEKRNRPKVMLCWPHLGLSRNRVRFSLYWCCWPSAFCRRDRPSASVITARIVDEALVGRNLRLLLQLWRSRSPRSRLQAITVAQSYINSWISQLHHIRHMKNQMYAHLQRMPHSFYTNEKQGDILTRMDNDISGVGSVITDTLTNSLGNITTVAATLIALFAMNWKMALVGVAVIPLFVLPTRSVGRMRWKLLSETQAERDKMNSSSWRR